MLVPRSNFDLFDDFFDDEFFPKHEFLPKKERNLMKTDIKETKDGYKLDIDLPGFEKENINLSLDNGYLNVHAKVEKEDKDESKTYVRRERFTGEVSRSFYVGEDIKEDEVKASFKNGILTLEVPKLSLEDKKQDKKL